MDWRFMIDRIVHLPDLISDLAEDTKELGNILNETREDLNDLCTEGFVEMVIKGKSDYKTSNEKVMLAHSIISDADQRKKNKKAGLKRFIHAIEVLINEHESYRQLLKDTSLAEAKKLIEGFAHFDVEKYINDNKLIDSSVQFSAPSSPQYNICEKNPSTPGASNFGISSCINAMNTMNAINANLLSFEFDRNGSNRRQAATIFLEDAKEYSARVDLWETQVNSAKAKFKIIKLKISEERTLLNMLVPILDEQTKELQLAIEKCSFTTLEAKNLKSIQKILIAVYELLNTHIVAEDGTITKEYKKHIKKLQLLQEKIK